MSGFGEGTFGGATFGGGLIQRIIRSSRAAYTRTTRAVSRFLP